MKITLIFLAAILSFTVLPVIAGEAEDKGMEIATQRKLHDQGWGDSQAEMVMTLRNKSGQKSVRNIRIKNLEVENDGDKGLTIFDRPRDVKGTAFLSFSHPLGNDDQWLYLPALKRVKRISSKNKSGPFMGSEFAYEDLTSFEVEKYSYKYLADENCGDQNNRLKCYKIENTPLYKHSGYTKIISWIDQQEYRVYKVEYYDRKKSLLKTLTFSNYKQYNNKFWRADNYQMINHQTGKSTSLTWKNYQFSLGLSDKDFNKNSLKRVR
ncbi:MAG: outer membrane lipoprotein-sorting protein [gamma proteobacterium symbiont of Taylorina sp.]|nr:outer membrane lipoprotein-sorting protein [gamma proteobacterium symbiont of Taylorina sp.]